MSKQKPREVSDKDLFGGKIPPHSRELEMNVLGGMIIDNGLIDMVGTILKPKHFYVKANGIIYDHILAVREAAKTVDLITLTESLKDKFQLDNIGGPFYLAELSTAFSSQESIIFSANKILENWIKRDLILLTYSINELCYDPTQTSEDLINKAQQELLEVQTLTQKHSYSSLKITVKNNMEFLEDAIAKNKSGIKISGVPSGYDDLDKWTGGFQKADLIIIAGRPSHGKTALALNFARNAAVKDKKNIGIFSIEMSQRELGFRYMALEGKTDLAKMKTGQVSEADFMNIAEKAIQFGKLPANIIVDESSPLDFFQFRSKARRMMIEHNIDMFMIDYLQLMDYNQREGLDRHLEIAKITRGLKQVAKELDVPVCALAQLSRKVEERGGNKRPMLSDLRESGAIEQDADVIIFVNRPEIYMSRDSLKFKDWEGIAEVIVAKQRNGPTGETKLTFIKQYAGFKTYSSEIAPEYVPVF